MQFTVGAEFNRTLERSLRGENQHKALEFAPNAKLSCSFNNKFTGGVEDYGALGALSGFNSVLQQKHQLVQA